MHGDLVHEDFFGRPVPKAFARCFVDPVGVRIDRCFVESRNVRVGRHEPPQMAIEVLDTALLPRRSGFAEVAFHPKSAMERWIGSELGSPIECDRSAKYWGKGSKLLVDTRHDPIRASAWIAPEHSITAQRLRQGKDQNMGHFSVKIYAPPGSALSDNQQLT